MKGPFIPNFNSVSWIATIYIRGTIGTHRSLNGGLPTVGVVGQARAPKMDNVVLTSFVDRWRYETRAFELLCTYNGLIVDL
jgi:hypothetical protein